MKQQDKLALLLKNPLLKTLQNQRQRLTDFNSFKPFKQAQYAQIQRWKNADGDKLASTGNVILQGAKNWWKNGGGLIDSIKNVANQAQKKAERRSLNLQGHQFFSRHRQAGNLKDVITKIKQDTDKFLKTIKDPNQIQYVKQMTEQVRKGLQNQINFNLGKAQEHATIFNPLGKTGKVIMNAKQQFMNGISKHSRWLIQFALDQIKTNFPNFYNIAQFLVSPLGLKILGVSGILVIARILGLTPIINLVLEGVLGAAKMAGKALWKGLKFASKHVWRGTKAIGKKIYSKLTEKKTPRISKSNKSAQVKQKDLVNGEQENEQIDMLMNEQMNNVYSKQQ